MVAEHIGILLANLGTPDAPTPTALRRYLKEFLWDRRVVDLPRPLWWLILNGIILNTRPKRSARLYERVWTPEGSPLLAISRRQAEALRAELACRLAAAPPAVALGMRYGQPSIASGLEELARQGCARVLVLPLYPQYSGATVGSTFDAVAQFYATQRAMPALRLISHYHAEPGYIAALAASIRELWQAEGKPDRLLFSFHGLPKRYAEEGDPYPGQCHETARLTAAALGLAQGEWMVCFQSRFGREEWLQPYTDKTLAALPGQSVRRVDVICPGFAADCLETLEEIAMTNRELFMEAGGERYRYLPALNAREDHMCFLADLAARELAGWLEAPPGTT